MKNRFVHPDARVETSHIGAGTRVWAFAHILPGAKIGAECNICDHVFIENDVVVGDRVTVKCGVQLWDGLTIEDNVFIGPNATFTNDKMPRSQHWLDEYPRTVVRAGASVGANATILPGLTIGRGAMIGAGAVVTKNVPPFATVVGNPARILGYVDADSPSRAPQVNQDLNPELSITGVRLLKLPTSTDMRGSLAAAEFLSDLPFEPKRLFTVYDVPSLKVRGEHAHKRCHQILICVAGECQVMIDDGRHRQEIRLDRPDAALHIPPMIWAAQHRFSSAAVLVVLASDPYDSEDYIREYEDFLTLRLQQAHS